MEPGLEGLVKQAVVSGVVIAEDLTVFVQLEVGEGGFDDGMSGHFGAADGLLVGGAGDLAPGHLGDKDGTDGFRIVVAGEPCRPDLGVRVGGEAGQQFFPEAGPGFGEGRGIFGVKGVPAQKFPGLRVHILSLDLLPQLPPLGVAGDPLDHAVCGDGHHCGVHGVVQVAVVPVFPQAQPFAHIVGDGAVDGPHRPLGRGGGEEQAVVEQVVDGAGDVLGVHQIALFEAGAVFLAEGTLEEFLALAVVADMALHQGDKIFRPLGVGGQVFQGKAVALLPVFGGTDQDLVPVTVVEGDAVRNDVVHVHITGFKEPCAVQLGAGIEADAVLLPIELELDQILTGGPGALDGFDLLHEGLICLLIFLILLVDLMPLFKVVFHFPGQFDGDALGGAVSTDNGVEDLGGLGDGAQNHGIVDGIQPAALPQLRAEGDGFSALDTEVAPVVAINGGAGGVVIFALFQMGDELLHGGEGQAAGLAEGEWEESRDDGLIQSKRRKGRPAFIIGFIETENGAHLIQLLGGQMADVVFLYAVQGLAELVITLHLLEFGFLFRLLGGPLVVSDDIKGGIFREGEGLAELGIVQAGGLQRQSDQGLPLLVRESPGGRAGGEEANVVEILEELEILKGIAGLACPPLAGLKGTKAAPVVLSIGTVTPGAFIEISL